MTNETQPSNIHYETIVIGSGSGGMTVAIGLSSLGRKVALIEGNHVGGDCTNVGCVPSKTLINLVSTRDSNLSAHDIFATVQRKRDVLRDEETEEVQHTEHLTFIRGYARFAAPKRLAIAQPDGASQTISGDNIVIATGSRPRHIDIPGLPAERTLTNESLFDLNDAPRHLVIVGSGVIAMEMAFAFRKLGCKVTLATRSERVMSNEVPEASDALLGELQKRGIDVVYHATPASYDEATETLTVNTGDTTATISGVDRVLLAVGRVRNLERLDLDKAGVDYDKRNGIAVDSYGQTTVPGVYAIGDVTPTSHFTHSANAQGRRTTQKIAFPWLPAFSAEPLYPSATFSDPEVASVGMSPKEIANKYHPNLIKRLYFDLKKVDRGYTDGLEHGFILVYAMRMTGRILGVTIVGPRASEMLSLFTLAITQGISLYKLYRIVYPYPTYANGIQKIADMWMRETLPYLSGEALAYARYRFARPQPQQDGTLRPAQPDASQTNGAAQQTKNNHMSAARG